MTPPLRAAATSLRAVATSLRAAAGFRAPLAELEAGVKGFGHFARGWEAIELGEAQRKWLAKHPADVVVRLVRRGKDGRAVATVTQTATTYAWTAEGVEAEGEDGVMRRAPSLFDALWEADSHLEAEGWALFAPLAIVEVSSWTTSDM